VAFSFCLKNPHEATRWFYPSKRYEGGAAQDGTPCFYFYDYRPDTDLLTFNSRAEAEAEAGSYLSRANHIFEV
jgi:hypothetical protein